LLESELFGYEKGAFTGATERRLGKLELADGGTLFLDEIGEMPLDMQVRLLRFLETREIMRVSGNATIRLDVRLIAATNQDLTSAVERERFRKDLYYRLKVVTLQVPPLRERTADIPLLVWTFIERFAQEHHKTVEKVSSAAMEALTRYAWPGNVRELRNVIENLVVFSKKEIIELSDLPLEIGAPAASSETQPRFESLAMADVEKQAILQALEKTSGDRVKASQLLGIGLRTLQRKLKEYRMTSR